MNQRNEKWQRDRCTIAVVGGGFTGATLAAQVLRGANPALSMVLIERGPRLGRGVAYATGCADHLLNTSSENMSAFQDAPFHFLHWAQRHFDSRVKPFDFLPRHVYGDYVESVLREQIRLHPGQFEWRRDEAYSITRTGDMAEIVLRGGEVIRADRVVLALGNFPPSDPALPGKSHLCQRYIHDPWAADALDDVPDAGSILLLGSGLTSVDIVVAVRARQFNGTIHILSRHGLLPRGHKTATSRMPIRMVESFPLTTSRLMRLVRTLIEIGEVRGCDWRSIIDAFRPFTQQIWQSLPLKERRRFLRHVRPYWEVHRHRLAPEIDALLASELRSGQVQIHAGTATAYSENADGVEITYHDRLSGKSASLFVDRVLNCTGPETDCRKVSNPLMKNLLSQKLCRPDPLFLGLEVSEKGALIDGQGVVSDFLFAIGPLRKGSLWETTAVPEIREQISELARLLLTRCAQQALAQPGSPQATVSSEALVEAQR